MEGKVKACGTETFHSSCLANVKPQPFQPHFKSSYVSDTYIFKHFTLLKVILTLILTFKNTYIDLEAIDVN